MFTTCMSALVLFEDLSGMGPEPIMNRDGVRLLPDADFDPRYKRLSLTLLSLILIEHMILLRCSYSNMLCYWLVDAVAICRFFFGLKKHPYVNTTFSSCTGRPR
ncbi:hypothetical protein EDD36DRAFT_218851 [Exophiala viscosa]|uniref:Uncharacterized protein n=1 Tax=Exophiala viscosa TaxID=2486360 RepID=A0AAN6DZD0_9EURO|nr:hypothetical protein EDD36DRAFT_218851 [Exophiala viscosa]